MQLEIRQLDITFRDGLQAIRTVDLVARSSEFVAIVGPSGCGKSTLLNAIAGLLTPQEATLSGQILVDGRDVRSGWPGDLDLGYVFQHDSLLPWRTVESNVAAGLEIRGVARRERSALVTELLAVAGLKGFEQAYPHQLSGGMRQRVALMRTLAYQPKLILMDEPFGALDAQTRLVLQAKLLEMWERTRPTVVLVTHDLAEAISLAQRVVLFSSRPGSVRKVISVDLPHPRDPFQLRGDARFVALETQLWQLLKHDFRDSAAA